MQKLKNESLNRMSSEAFRASDKTPLVVVLDNVRSALNVGSVFRTADAFRIEKIILCGITASPPHKDILKTALGATQTVVWEHTASSTDALLMLKKSGYQMLAIEQTDQSISLPEFKPEPEKKIAVVFGHEVNGVDQSVLMLCDHCLEVPQFGTKHSLNIAVCAGIVLWDLMMKIRKQQSY